MLPKTHVIRVWFNQYRNFEGQCTCQWGAVAPGASQLEYFARGHKAYWEMRGQDTKVEGQDGCGFDESIRAALQAVAPQPEPAPASETGPGPESLTPPPNVVPITPRKPKKP